MTSASAVQSTVAKAAAPLATAGFGLGALAFGLFSLMDATVKWLSASYSVPQILACNALFALLPVGVMAVRRGGLAELRTRRLGMHVLRGLLGTTSGLLAFYAFSRLPLADAYAIIFATPLLITALSVPILGEAVGWRRWSAVVVGFIGVLVMLRPGVAPIGRAASLRSARRALRPARSF
jgi:drug/metabolite transporter (DMT)-like permease